MSKRNLKPRNDFSKKGGYGRRLMRRFKVVGGVKWQLHATKGWRKYC